MTDGDELPLGMAVGIQWQRGRHGPDLPRMSFVVGGHGSHGIDDGDGMLLVEQQGDGVANRIVVDVRQHLPNGCSGDRSLAARSWRDLGWCLCRYDWRIGTVCRLRNRGASTGQ